MRNYPTDQLKKIVTEPTHLLFSAAVQELELRNELEALEVSESAEAIGAQIKILARAGLNSNLLKINRLLDKLTEPSDELKPIQNRALFLQSNCEEEKAKIVESSIDAMESENALYFGSSKLLGIGSNRDINLALRCLEIALEVERGSLPETLYFFGMSGTENHWDFDRSVSMFEFGLQNRNPLALKFVSLYLETKIKNPEQIRRNFKFNIETSNLEYNSEEELNFLALNMEKDGAVTGTDVVLAMLLPKENFELRSMVLGNFVNITETALSRIVPIFDDGRSMFQQIEDWVFTNFYLISSAEEELIESEFDIFLNINLKDISLDGEIQVLFNHYLNFEDYVPDEFLNLEISRFKLCLSKSEFCEFIGVSRQAYDGWKKGVPIRESNKFKVIEKLRKGEDLIQRGLWPSRELVLNQKSNRAKLLDKMLRN